MKLDTHFWLTGKYAKWILYSILGFFCALIVYVYSGLFLFKVHQVSVEPKKNGFSSTSQEDVFQDILKESLFGVYVPDEMNDDTIQQSLLNVTVVGILFDENHETSQVIIRDSNGREKTYLVGDKIPGGAVIKRITANGVILERDGSMESITLPKNDLHFEPVAKPLKEE